MTAKVVAGRAAVVRAVVAVEDRGAVRVAGVARVDPAEAAATGKVRRESEYRSHVEISSRTGRSPALASGAFVSHPIHGVGEIRTHGPVARSAVFKTAALNHSATTPEGGKLFRRSEGGQAGTVERVERVEGRETSISDPRPSTLSTLDLDYCPTIFARTAAAIESARTASAVLPRVLYTSAMAPYTIA